MSQNIIRYTITAILILILSHLILGQKIDNKSQQTVDLNALLAIYNSTNGPNWTNNIGWVDGAAGTSTDYCNWFGVTCDGTGRVKHLQLAENQLNGTIPSELGDLLNLKILNLWNNQLSGGIPSNLGNLSGLTRIYLHDNQLSGTIPSMLGSLGNLMGLYLENNQFSGEIPTQLGNLSNLIHLTLRDNQLFGTIPSQLGYLSSIEWLTLGNNQLSGSIPSGLGNLQNLTWLDLTENQLTGCIPATFSNLCGQSVSLYGNSFPPFSDFCTSGTACLTVPSNDMCQNAFDLPVNTICQYQSFTLSGAQASNNPSQYLDCGNQSSNDADVWFSAIVPASGNVKIQLDTYGTNIEAYTGTCNNLTPFYCSTNRLLEISGRTPGEVMYFRVMQPYQATTFDICAIDEAPSQNCGIRLIELGAQSACDPITNTYMQEFVFHLEGNINNSYLAVPNGGYSPTTNPFIVDIELPAITQSGDLYFYSYENSFCNEYNFDNLPLLPPCGLIGSVNDDCLNAIQLEVSKHCENEYTYLLPSNTNGQFECWGSVMGDVWFKSIVPPSGNLTVFAQEKDILLYTGVEVYRGNDCNTLALVSNLKCGVGQVNDAVDIIDAIPGELLYFRVAHLGSDRGQGDFSICAIEHEPVDNNDCSQAVVLSPTTQADAPYIVRNNYAQPSSQGAVTCDSDDNRGDLWFKIENSSSNPYQLSFQHPTPNGPRGYASIRHELYEGSCGNLTNINCGYGVYNYTTSNEIYLRLMGQHDEHHFLAAITVEYIDDCPEEQQIVQGLIGDYNFHSAQSITASNDVEFESIVDYRAGDCIELQPSFEVHKGATFTANIENCIIGNPLTAEKGVLKASNDQNLKTIKAEDGYYYTVKDEKGIEVLHGRVKGKSH